ncbi:hypothetical protein AERO_08225 [Aeromicrobium fastidiosum]|uniref:hypothetical protein n=1 Tax=Aeromicrobium fastidiosum TaxID=52699 RepID=UPI0020236992|nr:hypothetical protein [Aeromicrobium fastidiosum]MCL8251368.1 hypothetical protein [Aeromicrobium fastidiosum]
MVFQHRIVANGNRPLSVDQDAAIEKAIRGGRLTETEMGFLHAAALYSDAQNSARAESAITAATKKGRRR